MKLLVIISTIILSLTLTQDNSSKVYICTGGSSKKYHKTSSCTGLSRCSGEVKSITLDEAKKIGRTPCGICYK